MKHLMRASLLAISLGLAAGTASAADYRLNPFKLAYEGAITQNVPGEVNVHPVTYPLNGIEIAANFYTPPNFDARRCAYRPATCSLTPPLGWEITMVGYFRATSKLGGV